MSGSEAPEALVGALLNRRYRLEAVLGEGGLGVVYRAVPEDGSPRVAVKVLKPEFRNDAEVVDRFLSEATLAQRVEHPGVVRTLGAFRAEDGTPYLVSELLTGHPLTVRMNRGPLPIDQAVRVTLALLSALEAAHQVGVVHRDLKPDNVFLEPDDELGVRLLDFGISRAVEAAGGSARKTKTGMLLGTPGYMSPEQVRNSKDADHRSDLFSAGVLFYELITGRRAFDGQTDYERMMAVLFSDAEPIERAAPHYAHWSAFFAKALDRNVDNRFQSAAEMREALANVATHGRMAAPTFGGDNTALSPAAATHLPVERAAPEVPVVAVPFRSLRLQWVVLVALAAGVLGFLLGLLVG